MSLLSLLATLGCSSAQKRPPSDHFDGKKFFNPTLGDQKLPGFSQAFRLMSEGRAAWPEDVENTGVPQVNAELNEDEVAVTFINHATFLLQWRDLNVLTDPVWSKRASPLSWVGPKRVRPPGLSFDELPPIHAVLLSHNHYDHLDIDTLQELERRFSPQVIVAAGDEELVRSIGMQKVVELDWWESIELRAGVRVTFTPTQHSSARGLFDRDASLWGGYFIQTGGPSVYFGGDAGYSSHFLETRRRLGSPDIALLGIGAYAPRWFMKVIHMNPAEAVRAHQDLAAAQSIGMHFGTFQLASEGFNQPVEDLDQALKTAGISKELFTTLPEGGTEIFPRRTTEAENGPQTPLGR